MKIEETTHQATMVKFKDQPAEFCQKSLEFLGEAMNGIVEVCHTRSVQGGWYTNLEYDSELKKIQDLGVPRIMAEKILEELKITKEKKRNIGEMLALIHSEVSEGLEGHRKNLMDDKLPHRRMIEVEMADTVIRIADLAGHLKLDLGGAIIEKLAHNAKRADHKIENRAKENGKAY